MILMVRMAITERRAKIGYQSGATNVMGRLDTTHTMEGIDYSD